MLKLKEISQNNFEFQGGFSYTKINLSKIEHNGKIYTNQTYVDTETTISKFKEESSSPFQKYGFEFTALNYSIKIEDYNGFNLGLSRIADPRLYSENHLSNLIQYAFNLGILDKRILGIFSGNKNSYSYYRIDRSSDWKHTLDSLEISLPLFDYGFNNTVFYNIKVEELFKCDIKYIPKKIIEMFIEKGINLKSKKSFNEQINFINLKIKQL